MILNDGVNFKKQSLVGGCKLLSSHDAGSFFDLSDLMCPIL